VAFKGHNELTFGKSRKIDQTCIDLLRFSIEMDDTELLDVIFGYFNWVE
jgi:hypothetical protein